jgi:hypothetical protein
VIKGVEDNWWWERRRVDWRFGVLDLVSFSCFWLFFVIVHFFCFGLCGLTPASFQHSTFIWILISLRGHYSVVVSVSNSSIGLGRGVVPIVQPIHAPIPRTATKAISTGIATNQNWMLLVGPKLSIGWIICS